MEYLNGWTKEKVIEHVKSNFKGKSGNLDECYYRHPDDDRPCIAGCFIPDDMYSEDFENNPITYKIFENVRGYMPFKQRDMLEWQLIHDRLDENLPVKEQLDILLKFLD